MLTAVNGYIDGNRVIVDENLGDWQGREVIVTILNSKWDGRSIVAEKTPDEEKRKAAAKDIFGLWKDRVEESSVDEIVRGMRRGRRFDN